MRSTRNDVFSHLIDDVLSHRDLQFTDRCHVFQEQAVSDFESRLWKRQCVLNRTGLRPLSR